MATAINNFMLQNEGEPDEAVDDLRTGFQNRGMESPSFYTPHQRPHNFENSTRPIFYNFL